MSRHPKADLYRSERDKGLSYTEIARKYGVSKQAVAQACGKLTPGHFNPYTEKEVVYPNLRRWLNENRVCRAEFGRRMGHGFAGTGTTMISAWFRGGNTPQKSTIDKILKVTGLTYEELFSPVETEPKGGPARWKKETEGNFYWFVCSHCGGDIPKGKYRQNWFSDFCPSCGKPMEEDAE